MHIAEAHMCSSVELHLVYCDSSAMMTSHGMVVVRMERTHYNLLTTDKKVHV